MKKSILVLQDVSKAFTQAHKLVPVLEHASATFEQGITYAILGVSGTGKSTLLQLLAGLESPDEGAVLYNGSNIATYNEREQHQFLHKALGIVFQAPSLIAEFSVRENIMLKGLIDGHVGAQYQTHANELLEKIALASKACAVPAALSGGEQQRVALARALFYKPDFLIADEPTAHLDAESKKKMLALMLEFQHSYGMGLIIATHDATIAAQMQVCLRIQDGRLVRE